MSEYTIECTECGWAGDPSMLVCSEEDSDKPIEECAFNVCPECDAVDCFEDIDEEEEEDE